MHRNLRFFCFVFFLSVMVFGSKPARLISQEPASSSQLALASSIPDAPQPQSTSSQSGEAQNAGNPPNAAPDKKTPPPQPKRILGIMPNYRAVSAGVRPPPFTPREAFMVATRNSFDYSSFLFVGVTSLLAEGSNSHSELGKGVGGFWAYTWRGWVDKTDGNYMVDWAMPSIFHQDERYFSLGEGGVWKRGSYAATRVLIAPGRRGNSEFNTSEILGRGIAQAVSLSYYPSQTQTASGFAQKYAYAIGRDALTNVFREFWPDIDAHLIHRRH